MAKTIEVKVATLRGILRQIREDLNLPQNGSADDTYDYTAELAALIEGAKIQTKGIPVA